MPLLEKKVKDMTIEDIDTDIDRIRFKKLLLQLYTGKVKYWKEGRIEVHIDI